MNNLRSFLLGQGASLVGFGDVHEQYHPDGQIPIFPCGVSIALAIPPEVIRGISHQPSMDYYNAYHDLNDKLDELAKSCAKYIEERGYHAYAQTVGEVQEFGVYTTAMPHKTVAVASGLGWIGKSALFVTEEYGSAIRLTSVLTDAPLSVATETKEAKCGDCMQCKNACPGHAITGKRWEKEKERDWIFDAVKCRKAAREIADQSIHREITLCGKCIQVCPYTRRYVEGN